MAPTMCSNGVCHRTSSGHFAFGDPHDGSYAHGFLASKWLIPLLVLLAALLLTTLFIALWLLSGLLRKLYHKGKDRQAAKEVAANNTAVNRGQPTPTTAGTYNSAPTTESGAAGQRSTGGQPTATAQPTAAPGATETRSADAPPAATQQTTEAKQVPATTTTAPAA